MRAIILAGGKGVRLLPYTLTIPKPLVPIKNKAVLELIIYKLVKEGFKHITIAVNYKSDLIQAFIKKIKIKKIKIDFVFEKKFLGTMGPIKLIKNLPNNFLVINGDIITRLNMNKFMSYHIEKNHC